MTKKTQMKYSALAYLFSFLYACGQITERNLPEKSIYQIVKDNYITSLITLELKGNIKDILEEYKNTTIKDTIIDFSKYEVTNSDAQKGRGFISPHISKYYKASFNKSGYITNSITCKFGSNDSIFIDYKYNQNNLLISKIENEEDYYDSFGETKNRSFNHSDNFTYDNNKNLIKIESKSGKTPITFVYFPDKMQIKEVSDLQEMGTPTTSLKTYDKYGLLLSDKEYNDKNEEGDLWTYEYDKEGNQIKEKFKGKNGLAFENTIGKVDNTIKVYRLYDKNNNCIERIVLDRKGNLAITKLTINYY